MPIDTIETPDTRTPAEAPTEPACPGGGLNPGDSSAGGTPDAGLRPADEVEQPAGGTGSRS